MFRDSSVAAQSEWKSAPRLASRGLLATNWPDIDELFEVIGQERLAAGLQILRGDGRYFGLGIYYEREGF